MALPLKYNVRNLVARRRSSAMAAFGSALTALLLVALLAMGDGLQESVRGQASARNGILLHKGAPAEWSDVTREEAAIVGNLPEARAASPEYVNTIWIPTRAGSETLVQLRGVERAAEKVYDWFRLERGRWPRGSEVLVGRSAAERLDLAVGSALEFGRRRWRVSGVFSAGGGAAESEIWGDLDDFMADFRREKLSAVVVRTADANAVSSLVRRVERDRRLAQIEIKPETEYYEEQAEWMGFMGVLAALIAGCMGLGAALGGMNVFFTSVAQRTQEIGMLRVLGFRGGAILFSFVVEALLVGLAGSVVGATVGLGATFLQADFWGARFSFHVTPGMWVSAVIVGTAFALLGGLLPAVRASRLKAVTALRKG